MTTFTGLLIIPSVPLFVADIVLFIVLLLSGCTLFFFNQELAQREAALPMVTTRGIKSPEWSLAYETPSQVFYCALCQQSSISITYKVYYSRVDPQTLLVMGVHRCPAHTAHVPAVQAPKNKRRLRRLQLLHMGGGA